MAVTATEPRPRAPDDRQIAEKKRLALTYLSEAWNAAMDEGVDAEILAHAALFTALAELIAIVVRLVRSRLRRRRLMASLGLTHAGDAVDLDAVASGGASPEARAQLAQVYALLQTMPTEDRIAWTLRYVERHRLEAVAQLTDCSLATAKRRIARAQRFFEQHFVSGGSV